MTKKTLVRAIGAGAHQTVRASDKAASAVLAAIADGLIQDGVFLLPGVGTLKVVQRAARRGKDPRTGADIQIPARRFVKFSVSSGLGSAIQQERVIDAPSGGSIGKRHRSVRGTDD